MERIRQFFLSFLGIGTFAAVFYLVFRENQRFMIIFLISLAVIVLIIVLVTLILRIKDAIREKKDSRPL
jgi:hypothetical protein